MRSALCLAGLSAISAANAAYQGFNYGSAFADQSHKMQSDFEAESKTAQNLAGAPGAGFTSARLYTMIQGGTPSDPISAIPAAIATTTTLLLGIWCSAGETIVANELAALKAAVTAHGAAFTDLVVGISVGSEDLYRSSPTGVQNNAGPCSDAATIVKYIQRVREALKGTPLEGAPVGHVDTWTVWVESGNQKVLDAVDWVGMDAYGYWQTHLPNAADNNKPLFDDALNQTVAAVGGKPVWITETGFPVSGHTSHEAVPSAENAKKFWDAVGCPLFGKMNVWWFILRDAGTGTPEPSFGIVGADLGKGPLFDLSCAGAAEVGGDEGCDAE